MSFVFGCYAKKKSNLKENDLLFFCKLKILQIILKTD